MRGREGIRAAVMIAAACGAVIGCKADKTAFYSKLYGCNPSAADPACGTDINGQPMACVAAYQLGGQNFCATGCARNAEDDQSICLAAGAETAAVSGAKLKKCKPDAEGNDCGQEELSCLRTDLIKDEGVCMNVIPCKESADCRDPVRATCMGELLRDNYGDKAGMNPDHTYCVQSGCRSGGAACSPGEVCLRNRVGPESSPPDICVPSCDSNGNCPPNYFCYPSLYSKASPPICLPGLMGLRCRTRMDCLFGDCMPTGAGFNVCTQSCDDDEDCAKFDSQHGVFFCNEEKVCAGVRAFRGSSCDPAHGNDDCLYPGEICSQPFFTPAGQTTGQCLFACGADGSCPVFGGVNHTCLPQLKPADPTVAAPPICWPGHIGIPCRSDANCSKGLSCRATAPGYPNICSALCKTDQDCSSNRATKDFLARDSWCQPETSLCRAPLKEGDTCDRDIQCESRKCVVQKETVVVTPPTPTPDAAVATVDAADGVDAGEPPDAGELPDAGEPVDAKLPVDAAPPKKACAALPPF